MSTFVALEEFYRWLPGRHIAVCGIGRNNPPVVRQLLAHGAQVTACDKRGREALGDVAGELEAAGTRLSLGDTYLDGIGTADLILRTPGMKPTLPAFERARAAGVRVTSEMELFMELCPAPVTAVTGSDGKTTTTSVIAGLLEAAGRRVHLGGNIGRPLLPVIDEVRPDDEVVVELSSFQLMDMTVSPATAVITNLAPNHLDWHTDMDEYVAAKRHILAYQRPGDRVVLNADNALTAGLAVDAPGQVCLFSRAARPARGAWMDADGQLWCNLDGRDVPVVHERDILLPGAHNRENYLAAIAAVWGKASPAVITAFARTFGGVPHRCELVRTRRGVRWYNDSIGTSPSRTMAGLEAFDRPVILIAGGYDKHIPYAPLGPVAARTVKQAILMGATADAIEAALRACAGPDALPIHRASDMEQAVALADSLADNGDIVFMSPASASFDLYANFEQRGDHFKRLVAALD